MKHFLADEGASLRFAARLAPLLMDLNLVTLRGDLGAGKTTLVRGVLSALGYAGRVKSPTYTLVEPYEIGAKAIFHFDLYRLADPEELEYIGFSDYLDGESLCLVEWPEKGAGMLPVADLDINLAVKGSGREVSLEAQTVAGERAVKSLENDN